MKKAFTVTGGLKEMKRIGFFSVDSEEPYGATKSFMTLIEFLVDPVPERHGFFGIYFGSIGKRAEELKISTTAYQYTWHLRHTKAARWIGFFWQKFACAVAFIFFLRQRNCSVVYVNTCVYTLPMFCGWVLGLPVVVHMRDSRSYLRPGGIYRALRRWTFRHCVTRYIAISDNAARDLREELGDVNVSVVYNGLDLDQFRHVSEDKSLMRKRLELGNWKNIVLWVNRIDPQKGVDDFLDIAEACRDCLPDTLFLLVGGPVSSPFFKNQISPRIAVSDNVKHVPFQPDVRPFYAVADILVNTTHEEQFGRVNVEAMAMELCVISTSAGAIPEIIDDGLTGFLHEIGDIENFVESLCQLLADSKLREETGKMARLVALKRFGIETHVTAVKKILRGVTAGN